MSNHTVYTCDWCKTRSADWSNWSVWRAHGTDDYEDVCSHCTQRIQLEIRKPRRQASGME